MSTQPSITEPYTPNERKTPGQVAYERYRQETGFGGEWQDQPMQDVWESVASAVIAHASESFKP